MRRGEERRWEGPSPAPHPHQQRNARQKKHHQRRHAGLLARGHGGDAPTRNGPMNEVTLPVSAKGRKTGRGDPSARGGPTGSATRPGAGRRLRRSGSRARDRRAGPRRRTSYHPAPAAPPRETRRDPGRWAGSPIADDQDMRPPEMTRLGPNQSSSRPPIHAPRVRS